jgi:RNA polymerase sigma-70 factor (ECF subfamily)
MCRYGPAVRRYLLAAVRDAEVADDLTQEFALALINGAFHRADSERGRFRDYVKAVLFRLVARYRQARRKDAPALSPDNPALADLSAPEEDPDREFEESWRDELLARAWEALADDQPTFYSVLRFRAAHPKMPSGEMAEALSRQLNRPLTAEAVRQTLKRARERYSDLLLQEVAGSLESPGVDQIEEELRDLELLTYCQEALERRRNR